MSHLSRETWMKEDVLCLFVDTRDCSPSLANLLRGPRLNGSKQNIGNMRASPSVSIRSPSIGLSHGGPGEQLHMNSTRHLGEAVKQLAPSSMQSQFTVGKVTDTRSDPSMQPKGGLGPHHRKYWYSWVVTGDVSGKIIPSAMLMGCCMFCAFKFIGMRCGHTGITHKLPSSHPNLHTGSLAWTVERSPGFPRSSVFRNNRLPGWLGELFEPFRQTFTHPTNLGTQQRTWPSDHLVATAAVRHKRQMSLEEAENLVKQW